MHNLIAFNIGNFVVYKSRTKSIKNIWYNKHIGKNFTVPIDAKQSQQALRKSINRGIYDFLIESRKSLDIFHRICHTFKGSVGRAKLFNNTGKNYVKF